MVDIPVLVILVAVIIILVLVTVYGCCKLYYYRNYFNKTESEHQNSNSMPSMGLASLQIRHIEPQQPYVLTVPESNEPVPETGLEPEPENNETGNGLTESLRNQRRERRIARVISAHNRRLQQQNSITEKEDLPPAYEEIFPNIDQ